VTDAPDLVAPVVGFRDWRILDGQFYSRHLPVVWSEPLMAARCRPQAGARFMASTDPAPHRAPGPDCSCGVYAYYRPTGDAPLVDVRAVSGIVTVWGNVETHADGMRAEFARVEAIAVYSRWPSWKRDEVRAAAETIGVDLVDQDELEAAAARYGEPMPAALIPSPEPEPRRRRLSVGPWPVLG
jgi:hypothetical protein